MNEQNETPGGEILVYTAEDGSSRIRVLLEDETVWLTQMMLAALYETTKQNISLHIRNILSEGELDESAVVKDYLTTASDGKQYRVKHYNLDMIIAVGYRVRSPRGTQFRQWATEHLREYLVKGFTIDDERLKGGGGLADYFDELLARIREIRASEARVYQRIRDILALASDYVEDERATQLFFAAMQNKMHYAAAGMTAAEIIRARADAAEPNMGLTAWKGGHVLKRDVGTAKNYLDAEEIDTLNRITVMFLDQAEFRAQRRRDIRMSDWDMFLDKFLRDTELPVLGTPGRSATTRHWSGLVANTTRSQSADGWKPRPKPRNATSMTSASRRRHWRRSGSRRLSEPKASRKEGQTPQEQAARSETRERNEADGSSTLLKHGVDGVDRLVGHAGDLRGSRPRGGGLNEKEQLRDIDCLLIPNLLAAWRSELLGRVFHQFDFISSAVQHFKEAHNLPISHDNLPIGLSKADTCSRAEILQGVPVEVRHLPERFDRRQIPGRPWVCFGVLSNPRELDERKVSGDSLHVAWDSIQYCLLKFTDELETTWPENVNAVRICQHVKVIVQFEDSVLDDL